MRTAKRSVGRLALVGWLGLVGLSGLAAPAAAAAPPERMLPESTIFFAKMVDAKAFKKALGASQYGQLWSDPALKDFREEFLRRLEDTAKSFRETVGLSLSELIELPQGPLALAAVGRDDPKLPVAGVLIAQAGENEKKMLELLTRAAKQGESSGFKASTESFNGLTIHVLKPPPDADKKDDDKSPPPPPIVWTNSGSLFLIGSDIEVVKDVAAHREGRDDSLAASDSFVKTQKKTDSSNAQAIWYLDVARLVKVLIKANSKGVEADAQQNQVLVTELGGDGLKSIGGCLTLGGTGFDSLSKTFVLAPKPVSGLLKMFSLPPISLKPESWVPATVASYQTMSFDLDNLYEALNELVNHFQPGMLNIIEQQLVGPNGGQPLSLMQDLFGPLGDRITLISDFKKPIKDESQRALLAIALEDPKAFQNTLSRVIELTGAAPEKREFQGTTIYEINVEPPNAAPGGAAMGGLKGPISLAIAKDCLMVTTDASLLEQILRPGNTPLAESEAFQKVARELPEKASGMTFVRPDEQAKISYDMIKSGQVVKALEQAAAGRGGREIPSLDKLIPTDKLPDFSVFTKYLSLSGSFSTMDDDGFLMTGFTLRRANP